MTAMHRMVAYYHSKNIDMLKLGLTLPNLANNILHSSTDAKVFPFAKADYWYDSYIRQNLTGGTSIILAMRNSTVDISLLISSTRTLTHPFLEKESISVGLVNNLNWKYVRE